MLGVSILKYGSQLETTITHSINLKSSVAAQMEGLDIRILSITILLSLVFLSRALVDCMFAFNLINEQLSSFVMLLIVVIFSEVCTSVIVVKLMKKGQQRSAKTAGELATFGAGSDEEIDNHYGRAVNENTKAGGSRKHHQNHISPYQAKTATRSGNENKRSSHGGEGGAGVGLNESFSSYGSFN